MQPIIDTELLIERKRRAFLRAVPGADFLIARTAEDLSERLGAVERQFTNAATLFCVTPAAKVALLASGKAADAVRIEADAAFLGSEPGIVAASGHVPLDPESIDLAVSLLSLQDENDIPGMLIQIRRALKPDGLFLGVMAGSGTLGELRESLLAPRPRPLAARAPGSFPSPTCARPALSSSGPASRCPSPMSRRSPSATPRCSA